ncbi:MAG: DNA glycosylase AlkZ-like family protein [Thermoplasmata archaeon]
MSSSTPEVLTPATVRTQTLHAQGLLHPVASVEEALERTVGVSGAIPSGPLSLAARVEGFTLPALNQVLVDDRSVVRIPAMRGAVYLLPTYLAADGLALAKPDQFRPALVRAGMHEESYEALAESIEDVLSGKHLTGTEIRRAVGSDRIESHLPKEYFVFFLRGLTHAGRIMRVGVRGGSRSQTFEYGRTNEWLGAPLSIPAETEALTRLLPLYLKAHGPASLKDIAWWAGVTQRVAKEALRRVGPREVQLEGRDEVLYASESREGSSVTREEPSVTLLPHWDPYLTAHVDRARYLPDRWNDRVIDRGGNSTNVVLVEGQVTGVWDYTTGVLAYASFASRLNRTFLRASSRSLVAVLGDLDLDERDEAPSLHGGGQNAFRSPLRGTTPLDSDPAR